MPKGTALPVVRDQEERNALALKHVGLVGKMVASLLKRAFFATRLSNDDAMQAGYIGLLRAAELYRPVIERNGKPIAIRFSTYACLWIKQSIRKEAQEAFLIRIPHHIQDWRYAAACGRKSKRDRRYRTGKGRARLDKMFRQADVAIQAHLIGHLERDDIPDRFHPEGLDPDDRSALKAAISKLPERDQRILRGRYWRHETVQQIGDDIGITRERVRQLENGALAKLREILKSSPQEVQP